VSRSRWLSGRRCESRRARVRRRAANARSVRAQSPGRAPTQAGHIEAHPGGERQHRAAHRRGHAEFAAGVVDRDGEGGPRAEPVGGQRRCDRRRRRLYRLRGSRVQRYRSRRGGGRVGGEREHAERTGPTHTMKAPAQGRRWWPRAGGGTAQAGCRSHGQAPSELAAAAPIRHTQVTGAATRI
jgi:hypothetical protein